MERRLAAILSYDMVDYSLAIGRNETATLERLKSHRIDIIEPAIARHGGHVVKFTGDGGLVEFKSALDAVACALALQNQLQENEARAKDVPPIAYRVGINVGDIVHDDGDVFGDGVNVAARIEALADPGGVCIHQSVHEQLRGRLDLDYDDLGELIVKNIEHPVRVFKVIQNEKTADIRHTSPEIPAGQGRSRRLTAGIIALLAIVVILAGIGFWQFGPVGSSNGDRFTSGETLKLAILPFRNISDDPAQDSFAIGLAEDLIADLVKIKGIGIIARASSFQFRDGSDTPRQVAARLGARYIVGGGVRRAGEALRISVDLVDAVEGTTVWAQRFDGTTKDVFEFQDRITAQIVEALQIVLVPDEKQALEKRGTNMPQALEAYLSGLNAIGELKPLDIEGNRKARQFFLRAIEIDPDYAEAYAGLAWTNWLYYATIFYYDEFRRDAAFEIAEKSIALGDNALARRTIAKKYYRLVGDSNLTGGSDLARAIAELRIAINLEPGNADVLADLASLLSIAGEAEEGLRNIERAVTLNPNHPSWYLFSKGLNLLFLRRFSEAAEALRAYSRTNPNWITPKLFLAVALALDGNERLAQLALREFEMQGTMAAIRTYKEVVFNRYPMAPEARQLISEGLDILGVRESARS